MKLSLNWTFYFFSIFIIILSNPICQSFASQEKIILLPNQNLQINIQTYLRGFNLTYQLTSPDQASVELHNPLRTTSTVQNPCSKHITPNIFLTNILSETNGKWLGQVIVMLADEQKFCIVEGKIHNFIITFQDQFVMQGLDVEYCTTINKAVSGAWVLNCHDEQNQIFYFYQKGQMRNVSVQIDDPIIKSIIYNDTVDNQLVSRVLIMTSDEIRIFRLQQQEISLALRVDKQFFNLQSLNLTDFILSDNLVISDYSQGVFRTKLSNDTISSLESMKIGSQVSKIGSIGNTYFILSSHQMVEFVWMQLYAPLNVYQVEDSMSDILSLVVNHQLIVIQTFQYNYIYKRGETSLNYLLQKSKNIFMHEIFLNPLWNVMIQISEKEVNIHQAGKAYISLQNLTQNANFSIKATSKDQSQQRCGVSIELQLCSDPFLIYPTGKTLAGEHHIPANTTLRIPIGDYFTGLNLSYIANSSPDLTYQFKTKDKLKLISAYATFQIIGLLRIDGMNFYKISRQQNTYYTEICSQSNLFCQPKSHRTINGDVVKFKIYSNDFFKNIITYTLKNQSNIIHIQRLSINNTFPPFPPFKVQFNQYDEIFDYTLSNEYIFVVHNKINVINVYKLDFQKYSFVHTIDNRIFKTRLFKPREVRINSEVSNNLFIRTVDYVAVVDFSTYNTRILSIIQANITSREQWDKWDFQSNENIIDIISSQTDTISQYSIIEPQKPKFLKYLPLLNLQIAVPIVSYMSPTNLLFVSTTLQKQSQLTVFKPGEQFIDSLFYSFPISIKDAVSNIIGLNFDQLIIMYQDSSYKTWAQRIYSEVTMSLSSSIPMSQFITTLPMNIILSSPKDLVKATSVLKIINYEERISTYSADDSIALPSEAKNLNITFDQSLVFKGPITQVDLISDGSWSDKVKLVHQFQNKQQNKNVVNYLDIIQQNGTIWILTQNHTIMAVDKNLNQTRNLIVGNFSDCARFTKNRQLIILFCEPRSGKKYVIPIELSGADVHNTKPLIRFDNWVPVDILKTSIIQDWLIILDNDILCLGKGIVYVYQIIKNNGNVSLVENKMIKPRNFNISDPNTKINDYQIVHLQKDLFHVYFTINKFGLVSGSIKFLDSIITDWNMIDLLNNAPSYMDKYQIQGNEILQLRVIDYYNTNDNLMLKSHHIVVITTLYGAHLQLQLSYDLDQSTKQLTFRQSQLIQAFNTYYKQTRLNWLTAPAFNSSKQNMFLTGYFNETMSNVTIVIYNLSAVRPNQSIKKFPIFTEGVTFECYEPANIAHILVRSGSQLLFAYAPICRDIYQAQNNTLLLYSLSNKISLVLNYKTPPKLTEFRFHAVNAYSYATYNLVIKFDKKDQMAWWQILLIVSGVVLAFVVMFCVIRSLRLCKQKQEQSELSSLLTNDNLGDVGCKQQQQGCSSYKQKVSRSDEYNFLNGLQSEFKIDDSMNRYQDVNLQPLLEQSDNIQ